MLAIDPRREFLSIRISKLDKRILRCFEMKVGASDGRRSELDAEIGQLRAERGWMMNQIGQIPWDETSGWVLRELSKGPSGGSAETSAAFRPIT